MPNEIFNEFFRPRHKIMCDYVKANSSAHTMLHYCGGIYELIPVLSNDASHVMDLARLVLGDPLHPKSVYGCGGNWPWGSKKEAP
jgi:uroporphyrinogen decarboxylase